MEVAEVVVELVAVKSWRVVEPLARSEPLAAIEASTSNFAFEVVAVPPISTSVLEPAFGKIDKALATLEVANLELAAEGPAEQPVQLVTVRLPMFATFARRSVVEAMAET